MWCICSVTDKFVDSFQSPTRRYSKHQVTTCRRGAVVHTIVHTSVIDLYRTRGFFFFFIVLRMWSMIELFLSLSS